MKKIFASLILVMLMTISAAWAAPAEMNLKVAEPGASTEWTIGATNTVKWSFRGEPGQTVLIRLQRVGWVNVQKILAEAAPIGANRSGTFKWQTPADLPPGDDYSMTVMAENGLSDTSELFKLTAGKTPVNKLSLDSLPKGGDKWTPGSKVVIRWSYAGDPGPNVKVALIKMDEGAVTVLAPSVPTGSGGKGSMEWTVLPLKPGTDYYIGIVSNTNAFFQDKGKSPVAIGASK